MENLSVLRVGDFGVYLDRLLRWLHKSDESHLVRSCLSNLPDSSQTERP